MAALRAALHGPGAAPYDLEIDDILMLGQELEQLTEPLYIELRSNGAGCAVPRRTQHGAERRDLASWGLLPGAAQELVWSIDHARQRGIATRQGTWWVRLAEPNASAARAKKQARACAVWRRDRRSTRALTP